MGEDKERCLDNDLTENRPEDSRDHILESLTNPTLVEETLANNNGKSTISTSLRSFLKRILQERETPYQWSKTKSLGEEESTNSLKNDYFEGQLLSQGSCQKEIILPSPNLNIANKFTYFQTLEIFIQGVHKLEETFPEICHR